MSNHTEGVISSLGTLFLPLMLLFCVLYYWSFAADLSVYDDESGVFQHALNYHDHLIYVDSIDRLRGGDVQSYELNNDLGIAAIYLFLSRSFPFFEDQEYRLLSLVFNCTILVGCYLVYANICDNLKLGVGGKVSFFLNLYFIYFAQLINKDMLTVLSFLLVVWSGLHRKLWLIAVLLPFFILVRQQLAIFALAFMFLMPARRAGWRILILYVLTSLTAGLLSVLVSIIGEESLGDGFSAFLVDFNRHYLVGYLLFNPIRIVQFMADAYSSFFFFTETGGIDVAKVLRLPQLVVLLLLVRPLASIISDFWRWLETPARPLVLVLVCYCLVWLMNPTVNARYVMLITPVLVLFAMYAARRKVRMVARQ